MKLRSFLVSPLKEVYKGTNFRRSLSLQEHLCISLLKDHGISVPAGRVAFSPDEAYEIANSMGSQDYVVKSQIMAGGRGKGFFKKGLMSGIHIAYSPENVRDISSQMIGDYLVTKQTGPDGLPCNSVLISERLFPRREFYAGFALDRKSSQPILIFSSSGGVDIEETSIKHPELIHKLPINMDKGLDENILKEFILKVGITKSLIGSFCEKLTNMYQLFIKKDLSLLEVNPMCETNDGRLVAMDCKIQVDDNSLFRHEELELLRDYSQENPLDVIASKSGINYIKLDGTIGCIVNGAGLAMATMDILTFNKGRPANFLDIGGGASVEQVLAAFQIITSDPKVSCIFINIFGGIMRCDIIAEGIIKAAKTINIKVPLVVRLQGTKLEEAMLLFSESSLRIITIEDFDEASRMSVKLSSIVTLAQEANIQVSFELPI